MISINALAKNATFQFQEPVPGYFVYIATWKRFAAVGTRLQPFPGEANREFYKDEAKQLAFKALSDAVADYEKSIAKALSAMQELGLDGRVITASDVGKALEDVVASIADRETGL